ncbi:hypothetical protein QCA50_014771 [Cerrena zonata]|uniref:Uncharacterized protein n=1 Tax=Cerrena zonata TaxID=2478898 RepID=A0AAW0FRI9_9APHY
MAPKKAKSTRPPPVEEDDPAVITAVRDLRSRSSALGIGTVYLRDHDKPKEMTRRVSVITPTASSSIPPDAGPSKPVRSPRASSDRPSKPGEPLVNPSGDQNPNLMGVLALPYRQSRPRSGPPASSVRAGTTIAATQRPPSGGERAPATPPLQPQHSSIPQASSSRVDRSPHHTFNLSLAAAAAAPVRNSPQHVHASSSPTPQANSQSFTEASAQLQQPPALLPPFQVQRTLSAPQSRSFPVSPGSSPPHPTGPAHLQDWVNWTLRAAALCQAITELEKKL